MNGFVQSIKSVAFLAAVVILTASAFPGKMDAVGGAYCANEGDNCVFVPETGPAQYYERF